MVDQRIKSNIKKRATLDDSGKCFIILEVEVERTTSKKTQYRKSELHVDIDKLVDSGIAVFIDDFYNEVKL